MRILIITGTFHPEPGGPSRYLYNLARELTQRGHTIEVLTFGEVEREPDYPYRVRRISRRQAIPLRLLKLFLAVLRLGRRADVLFVNDHGLAPALANLRLRKRLVMKVVGDFAWEFSRRHGWSAADIDDFQRSSHPFLVRLLRSVQKFYVARACDVIVPSRYLRGLLCGWGVASPRIRVVYNAVAPHFAGETSAGALPARSDSEPPHVLTVARLTPWKGIDAIIRCMKALPDEFRLKIVGDGPVRPQLEQAARSEGLVDRVLFCGSVPQERISGFMRDASFLVLNSGYEGFSHVLLEAMSVSLPVLTTRKGGNPELVDSGKSGLLVEYGDEAALREAMVRLAADGVLRARLAEQGKQRVRRHRWEDMVASVLAILTSNPARKPRNHSSPGTTLFSQTSSGEAAEPRTPTRALLCLRSFGLKEASLYGPLSEMFRALAREGNVLHVLSRSRMGAGRFREGRGEVVLHPSPFRAARATVGAFLRSVWMGVKLVHGHRLQLVYSHSFGSQAVMGMLVSRLSGRPHVHWHCEDYLYELYRTSRGWTSWIDRWGLWTAMRLARRLMTCTKKTCESDVRFFGLDRRKFRIVPNSVDVDRFRPDRDAASLRRALGLEGRLTLLYFHRMSKRKGPQHLVEALPEVRAEVPNVVCVMAGEGPSLGRARLRAEELGLTDAVRFVGAVPSQQAPLYFAACDVFVSPSEIEGFGRVLIEAMACGRPVVATPVGGVPEVVPDGVVGDLVPPGDPEALARALVALLRDPAKRRRYGEAGRRRAMARYAVPIVARQYGEAFHETLRNSSAPFQSWIPR